ncbi:YteA family regulatory protein [Paenibacillus phyllosphaerae]|uniref:YteA family regulatory protein n=1 Tax=Paenibacillus phyllosphaerae TaxID=274593 RepID=A0A7W5FLE0_9BACL|nr:TraR/DksA C4-type zinc finger protein [Paenibacillus phyllosphaerae]MBB3109076.1 YteA family regulatory protein [Paenibacillus phyllosphaerae]
MSHLTQQQLGELRGVLEAEKQLIEERLANNEHYGLAGSERDETGELSTIDNHPADVATETFERAKDIALLEQEDLHLARITAALDAMDNGTYGICQASGQPIPYERLQALPESLYAVEFAPRQELSSNRPVEEEFLSPPFGRSSLDEHEYNGFDGEDAWQIVESWGNSDSPAYSENRDVDSYDSVGIEAGEHDGYVEAIESFLATDITGSHVSVVRNKEYYNYLDNDEGDHELELM